MKYIKLFFNSIINFVKNKLGHISAGTLGWMANICLHAATLPSIIALMTGVTNNTPPVDVILLLWAALGLLFFRSVLLKDILNIITIGVGFMLQAAFLILIFFK